MYGSMMRLVLILATLQVCCSVSKPDCRSPPDEGLCKAYFPRYYYNSAKQDCQEFVYGGCGGNHNNYETHNRCMAACRRLVVAGQ